MSKTTNLNQPMQCTSSTKDTNMEAYTTLWNYQKHEKKDTE